MVEKDSQIATIYLNRPQVLNALNVEVIDELHKAVDELKNDDTISVLVISGKGKAFAGGADLDMFLGFGQEGAHHASWRGHELFTKMELFPCPIIAAINGPAIGGGAELAWACDIRLASENAVFSHPEVSYGLCLGWGGTQRLPYLVGRSIAMEIMLCGDTFTAEQAMNWGLINKVVAPHELMDHARGMARKIASHDKKAIHYTKKATIDGYRSGGNSIVLESELFGLCFAREEPRKRITAFLDKLRSKRGKNPEK